MERAAVLETLAGQTPDQANLDAVRTQLEAAVRLDPYNPDPHALYATFCLSYVSADLGVQEFTRALDLQPWELRRHEKVAEVHCAVGFSYLRAGDASRARNHLSLAVAAGDRLEALAAGKAPAGMPPELALPPTSPLMCLEVGKAQALLGDYREAASHLKVAYEARAFAPAKETREATQARQAEAVIWLSLAEERLGDIEAAKVHTAKARAIAANADAVRDFVAPFLGLAGVP